VCPVTTSAPMRALAPRATPRDACPAPPTLTHVMRALQASDWNPSPALAKHALRRIAPLAVRTSASVTPARPASNWTRRRPPAQSPPPACQTASVAPRSVAPRAPSARLAIIWTPLLVDALAARRRTASRVATTRRNATRARRTTASIRPPAPACRATPRRLASPARRILRCATGAQTASSWIGSAACARPARAGTAGRATWTSRGATRAIQASRATTPPGTAWPRIRCRSRDAARAWWGRTPSSGKAVAASSCTGSGATSSATAPSTATMP